MVADKLYLLVKLHVPTNYVKYPDTIVKTVDLKCVMFLLAALIYKWTCLLPSPWSSIFNNSIAVFADSSVFTILQRIMTSKLIAVPSDVVVYK
jgi:hypothetical protein